MNKIYVGIDISKEKCNLCYRRDLEIVREEECSNDVKDSKKSLIPCEKDPPAAGRREGPDVRLPCEEHSKIFRHAAITRHSSTSSSLMLSGNPSASRDKERVQ